MRRVVGPEAPRGGAIHITRRRRGICSACGLTVAVRAGGRASVHSVVNPRNPAERIQCGGSGKHTQEV